MVLSVVVGGWWSGGITFVNEVSGVIQGATTTTDVTLPAGLAEGDVLVFMTAADYDFVGTEPTDPIDLDISRDGWFNLFASEDTSVDGYIYGLVCGASPPTTVRVRGAANATPDAPYVCQAWRGVDARVFDARSGSDYTTGSSASPNPPSVTTVTDGALVIAFAMMDDDDTTVSVWPTGYTNQIEKGTGNTGTSNQATIAMSSKIVTTAGSERPVSLHVQQQRCLVYVQHCVDTRSVRGFFVGHHRSRARDIQQCGRRHDLHFADCAGKRLRLSLRCGVGRAGDFRHAYELHRLDGT